MNKDQKPLTIFAKKKLHILDSDLCEFNQSPKLIISVDFLSIMLFFMLNSNPKLNDTDKYFSFLFQFK